MTEKVQVLLCPGPVPTQTTLRKLPGRAGGSFPFKSSHPGICGHSLLVFSLFTVINSLALNVCPSPLFALWAVSLMCIPRSAVTRSGAMELVLVSRAHFLEAPISSCSSWQRGWGVGIGRGRVATCPHYPLLLASFPGLAGTFFSKS